jgi:hypothetical protein
MPNRPTLTPCILCHRQLEYLYADNEILSKFTVDIFYGTRFEIPSIYGSSYESITHIAVICDHCLTTLNDNKLLINKESSFFP